MRNCYIGELILFAEVDNSQLFDRPGSLGFNVSSGPDESKIDTHEVSVISFLFELN